MSEKEQGLPDNIQRVVGKKAHEQNIQAATFLADLIKSTLGPKGMDKLLLNPDGKLTVTNDGVTILQNMQIDHPSARMIAEIAGTQENEVGDGTTTVAMLAGKLLEHAGKLLKESIHPTVIVSGYRLAAIKAKEVLNEIAMDCTEDDLKEIAMTAMTGKGAEGNKEQLAEIIVEALKIVEKTDDPIENIKIENIKGDVADSELVKGLVLDKEIPNEAMPKKVKGAKIALLDFGIENKNPEMDFQAQIETPGQLDEFKDSEKAYLVNIIKKLKFHKVNVVFTNKGIEDYALSLLAESGIMGIRRVNQYDMELLARSTNAKILSDVDQIKLDNLGSAGLIEQIRNKNSSMIYIRDCNNPEAVTILIHGSSDYVMDEVKRAITDGLGDVIASRDSKILPGGGACEMAVALKLRKYATTLPGREQLAVEEFANVIEIIPRTLAENAGLDSINTLTELRKRHSSGEIVGLNLFNNKIEDTAKAGIIEPLKVKTQAIGSATEVATMILRIDDLLMAKTTQ